MRYDRVFFFIIFFMVVEPVAKKTTQKKSLIRVNHKSDEMSDRGRDQLRL